MGFIHSDKRTLIACIEQKGLALSPVGRAALGRQDARIYRWRDPGSAPVQEVAPEEASWVSEGSARPSTEPLATNPPQPARSPLAW